MKTFDIKDDFYLDDQPVKIISGAIHYFRVVPEYWRDRLEKLKALGCNTVETYVPWNFHEPHEGQFNFSGRFNLRQFIQIADELGLYVILRPAPYICAEWEFGGLPYWLMKEADLKVRFDNPIFLEKVNNYFARLYPEIVDLQITQGGPIIMMQIENEYGGFANDKSYMGKIADLMEKHGTKVPFVTSDGPWGDMLEYGSIQERALATINCGSKIKEHFKVLKDFHQEKKPLMVMEFWIGWFDAWGDEEHHTMNGETAAHELSDILEEGSVNIYMFHGGTNFGFSSGANYYEKLAPDVTSYDYDALLTEWGDITPKYRLFQEVIGNYREIPTVEFTTDIKKIAYGALQAKSKTSLFHNLQNLAQRITHNYPLSMEQLDQGLGYIYYESNLGRKRSIEDFRLIGCMDRAQIFINDDPIATQYDLELGTQLAFDLNAKTNKLGILVENMGRVNYSIKMNHQEKGIRDGVIINGAFQSDWGIYNLPMDNLTQLDFSAKWTAGQPGFYQFTFEAEEIGDTFIELPNWGKGFVTVNDFNIGRFWEKGPQVRLYIPGPLLKIGANTIIIFESEGKVGTEIILTDEPKLNKD